MKQAGKIDIVINIQGDEPFINPEQIDLLKDCFISEEVKIATLIRKAEPGEDIFNPNQPKVILNTRWRCNIFQPGSNTIYKGDREK